MGFVSCTHIQKESTFEIKPIPNKRLDMQQQIVAQLSGQTPIGDTTHLTSRWTPEQRAITRFYLQEIIEQLGLKAIEHKYRFANSNFGVDLLIEPYTGANLYTILPATTPTNQYIILGAHYDTGRRNAPGAIDNATGIALIYAVVKAMQKLPERNQNIIMVFFDQEEEENIGSRAFIKHLQKTDWKTTSVHCFDMVGWDGNHDNAIEIYTPSDQLEKLYLDIGTQLNKKIFNLKINPVGYTNSSTDFDEFVRAGYNVIGAGECYYHKDSSPYKDTYKDTFETVDFRYLLSATDFIEKILKKLITTP